MDRISQLLEGTGSTPDTVAATVRRERVLGMRDSSSLMNPIVRYLNTNLGRLDLLRVVLVHLRDQLRQSITVAGCVGT